MSTTKASLRSFQDEIEQIHHKETAKQRAQAQSTTERDAIKKPIKEVAPETEVDARTIEISRVDAVEFDNDAELQVCFSEIQRLLETYSWIDMVQE